jgi:predicted nucleic acid-binding protein
MKLLEAARRELDDVATSAMTILEVSHPGLDRSRLEWVLSAVQVAPVTERGARAAARRMTNAGLRGHSHAIDAVVAELASRARRPVAVLTSDPGDLGRLCDAHVRVVRV